METHQAFHLKGDGMESKPMPDASMTILSTPINLNCGPGMYMQNEISPSSLQITVPRNKVISLSEPAPPIWDSLGTGLSHPSGSGQCVFPQEQGTTTLLVVTRAVDMLMTKAANIFHLGFSFVMLNKWGKKSPWQ